MLNAPNIFWRIPRKTMVANINGSNEIIFCLNLYVVKKYIDTGIMARNVIAFSFDSRAKKKTRELAKR